jgi:hypothetical protein
MTTDTEIITYPAMPAAERAHAKYAPSKLKYLEICPAYEDDPHKEVYAATERGTQCHAAMETGDDTGLDDEQKRWVQMCAEYRGHVLGPKAGQLFRETKLEATPDVWGYADEFWVFGKVAHLFDWKFGSWSQEDVATNPQTQAYVLGIWTLRPEIDTVHCHWVYPVREEISRHTYTRANDFARIKLRLETIVARCSATAVKANPVESVCTWCGNKAVCPALHRMVLPVATRYAEGHQTVLPQVPNFDLVKDPVQMSRLLDWAPILEKTAESIKRHALEMRQNTGQEIPGYDLRSRQGKSRILNANLAWEQCQDYMDLDAFMRAVDVSAAELKKLAGEKAPRGEKAKRGQQLMDRLQDAGVLQVGGESQYLTKTKA